MRLSFLPADLHLRDAVGGYAITIQGNEVFHTHSERAGITRFNRLRAEMEKKHQGGVGVPKDSSENRQALARSAAANGGSPRDQVPSMGVRDIRRMGGIHSARERSGGSSRSLAADSRKRPKNNPTEYLTTSTTISRKAGVVGTARILNELRIHRDRLKQAIRELEAL